MSDPPQEDGSFAVRLPYRNEYGDVVGADEVRNVHNEVHVFCGYGMVGGRVKINMYQIHEKIVGMLIVGDAVAVIFDDIPEKPLLCRIKNMRWAPPKRADDTWSFELDCLFESMWVIQTKPIISTKSDKLLDIYQSMDKMMDIAFANDKDNRPVIVPGKGHGIYKYDSFFLDGEVRLMDVIDDYVSENNMEWYCDPFRNAIYVGNPVGTETVVGESMDDILNRIKIYTIGSGKNEKEFLTFLFSGNPTLIVGQAVVIDEMRYKIVRAKYSERGNSYRESTGTAMLNSHTCTSNVNNWLNGDPADHRYFFRKDRRMFIGDIDPHKEGAYENRNIVKWRRKEYSKDEGVPPEKDPRKYEFYQGKDMSNIVMLSPFAGDGVGLRFPIPEKGRGVVIFPENRVGYGAFLSMMWKNGEQVPKCDPKDFYLRMDKGMLYLDESNGTWLLKASKVKLEANDPDPAKSSPNTTKDTGVYIKLEKGGTVVVEGSSIKLGKNASQGLAKSNHTHQITGVMAGPTNLTTSGPSSSTSKVKGE